MSERMFFVVGAPRSGTTLLMRMLNMHPDIATRPEPHLLTPLAHLGYYAYVDKAPYDPFQSAQSVKAFVADLPGQEQTYLEALRAYADTLYGEMLEPTGRRYFLDKTPAYSLILPFLRKLYPNAVFVIITRHPFAIFSSFAASFFDDDWQAAHSFNPVVERYVPAIAAFLRDPQVPRVHHVRYEDLVADPERELRAICEVAGIAYQPAMIDYGQKEVEGKGLGDPIGVNADTRPNRKSVDKWAQSVAAHPDRIALLKKMSAHLLDDDLKTFGTPRSELFTAIESVAADKAALARTKPKAWDRYALERRTLKWLRSDSVRSGVLGKTMRKLKFALDVVLRD